MEGGSTVVLLLHSLTNTPFSMYYLTTRLNKVGYTVYAPCLSGHKHERMLDLLNVSVSDWFQDSIKALDFLSEKTYKSIVVVGESLGGLLTIHLLANYPKVDKGIILSTPSFSNWNYQEIYNEVEKRVHQNAKKGLVPNLDKEIQAARIKLKRLLTELNMEIDQLAKVHSQITSPVLIGQAFNDPIVPMELADQLKKNIATSRIKYYETDEHLLCSSKVNSQLVEDILSFI